MLLVGLEDPGMAKVRLARGKAVGIPHHIALLVQPQNIPAGAVHEGFIEQQALAHSGWDRWQLTAPNCPDQVFQRLIVEFGIA